jgi:hypothetical protein
MKFKFLSQLLKSDQDIFLYDTWCDDKFDGKIIEVKSWYPNDTLEEYHKNSKITKLDYGVNDITYEINEYGYRTSKENNERRLSGKAKNIIACFGCSNTLGVGLPWKDTWCSILEQNLGDDWLVKNYGRCGASTDTISRLIYNYLKTEKPKAICCFFPHAIRLEGYDDGIMYFTPRHNEAKSLEKYEAYMKLMTEEFGKYLFIKNFKFIETLCKLNDVKFYWNTWCDSILAWDHDKIKDFLDLKNYVSDFDRYYLWEAPKARDNAHYGKIANERIGTDFYKKIIEESGG